MRKYLILMAAVLALATYEAHACSMHKKSNKDLRAQFDGGRGAAGGSGGGGVQLKNRGGSVSAMDGEEFFTKVQRNQAGGAGGAFTTTIDGSAPVGADTAL